MPHMQENICHTYSHCWTIHTETWAYTQANINPCLCCVYVCFTTRACHLKMVSDLSTTAFLACLRCFVSRRLLPHHVYSDNGSNFVGANNRLKEIYTLVSSISVKECVINWAPPKEIQWSFLPSRAPHFGGLWEGAVKSMKLLLHKTLGECKLHLMK